MAAESDSGLDKQKILAAITHPEPISYSPPAPSPGPARAGTTSRAVAAPPASAWLSHRSEIAAIVATFVSLVWIAAGIAAGSGTPIFIGILFGVGALAIWLLEVWSGD
jgi:hypothetical protein